jgi:hypothetical protein
MFPELYLCCDWLAREVVEQFVSLFSRSNPFASKINVLCGSSFEWKRAIIWE